MPGWQQYMVSPFDTFQTESHGRVYCFKATASLEDARGCVQDLGVPLANDHAIFNWKLNKIRHQAR
jgi:hypothetical protein